MSTYTVELSWERGEQDFAERRYSRRHFIRFDGGAQLLGSSSPAVVPLPLSDPAGVDPEEAFVASLASCHMLWFLDIVARQRYIVDRYDDRPSGVLERNAAGRFAMTRVTLRPRVQFAGMQLPSAGQLAQLHEQAHAQCYIANSVTTLITVEPQAG
jgi:organic hydroperoxide reductase OsmC/OhrA